MKKAARAAALGLVGLGALWSIPGGSPEWRGTDQARAAEARGAGVLVIDLKDDTTADELAAFEQRTGLDVDYSTPTSADEGLVRVRVADLASALAKVQADPLVEVAEPVVQMRALSYPDDPLYAKQWHLRAMGAPTGWRAGGGAGVQVAVLDTGVAKVGDLVANGLSEGWSFVPGEPGFEDEQGHGTHVAGTIAQTTHNGAGAAGVAPNAEIMPYKVLSARGGGASDHIAAAIDDAADRGADVINLSLGSMGHSQVLHVAIRKASRQGVVVVAAAGNTGRNETHCPADATEALAVAALGPDGQPAPYSTHGDWVEIAGPGGDTRKPDGGVLQETVNGGTASFQAFQGTSMATPHVAGAVAVLRGMGLSGGAAVRTLLATADRQRHKALYGVGRLDLDAAVSRVLLRHRLPRAIAASAFALLLVSLLRVGLAGGVFVLASALAASGLFFLPWLPVDPMAATRWLGRGVVDWPAAAGLGFGDAWWWAAAFVPGLIGFLVGLQRHLAPLVAALCMAWGVWLLEGALVGDRLVFETGWINTAWLAGHGLIGVGVAAAVMGVLHLRKEGREP